MRSATVVIAGNEYLANCSTMACRTFVPEHEGTSVIPGRRSVGESGDAPDLLRGQRDVVDPHVVESAGDLIDDRSRIVDVP